MNLNEVTFEQLRALGLSTTQSLRVLHYRERKGGFKSVDELDEIPDLPRAMRAELKRRARDGASGDGARKTRPDGPSDERRNVASAAKDAGPKDASRDRLKQLREQDIKTGRQLWLETIPKVVPYAKPYWKLVVLSILLTLVTAAFTLALPWPIALVFDDVLGSGDGGEAGFLGGIAHSLVGDGTYSLLVFALTSLFVLTVLEGSFMLLNRYIDTKLKLAMVLDFMSELFQHFQRLSFTFHQKSKTGALMNKVNQAPTALGELVGATAPIVQSGVLLLGMLAVAALIDWQVALAALLIVPLLCYQISLYGNRVVPRLRAVGQLEMNLMSTTHEAMQMLRLIVAYGREHHEYRRFRDQAEIANRERVKVTIGQTLFSLGVNAATALGTALVLGLGALHVVDGTISVGELVVLMTYIAAVYQPLQTLASTAGTMSEQLVLLSFALEVLDETPEIVEAPDAKAIERAEGRVTFEDVSFKYKGRKRTLQDITFDAQPGQRIAIVGETGSGKSTLASLMVRFYDPDAGRVLIDGIDIRELTFRSLREQISIVLQEPLLLSGTIEDNIRYGRLEAADDEVIAAAKAANAHDFISRLKDGYETKLGERGSQLSGGEQQRICVARAFLKDAPILILDEPTSSIDSKTEGVILDALDDLMVGRTSFMIAHRLSTIRAADLILVVRRGRIAAEGTHDELLASSNLYRKLFGVQAPAAKRSSAPKKRQSPVPAGPEG